MPHENRLPPRDGSRFGRSLDGKAEALRDRMADLRRGMSDDVAQVRRNAKEALKWHTYVRKYPLACVGAAALAGYLVVPSRKQIVRPTQQQLEQLAQSGKVKMSASGPSVQQQRSNLTQKAVLAVGTVAARALMAYFGKRIGEATEGLSPDSAA